MNEQVKRERIQAMNMSGKNVKKKITSSSKSIALKRQRKENALYDVGACSHLFSN